MARILTVASEEARGLRKLMVAWNRRRYGGVLPDLQVAAAAGWLYNRLHMRGKISEKSLI